MSADTNAARDVVLAVKDAFMPRQATATVRVEALAAKGRFALAVEAMLAVVGLLAFLSTQDLSAPMIYADALTLPMAAISGAVCVIENKMRCAQHERAARA